MVHSEDRDGSSRYSVTYNHPSSSTKYTYYPTSKTIFKDINMEKTWNTKLKKGYINDYIKRYN